MALSAPSGGRKWLLALAALVVALGPSEALLRLSLFRVPGRFASQDPTYYARTFDELWIYRHLFSASKRWAVAFERAPATPETPIEFYRKWATSLMPDPELGYVRKPNVRIPCHETTDLATRGLGRYPSREGRLVFFGDSSVESAACSNDTLTSKLERLTGLDVLNFGMGGYGLDQIVLYFKRRLPTLNPRGSLFLIGLIHDDLHRVLLKVRTSPKPYFTIADERLVLHTDHIHPDSLNEYFRRPPDRFYLYYFVRGRLGFPYYQSVLSRTQAAREATIRAISRLLIRDLADLKREGRFDLAVVIFPTTGPAFDPGVLSLLGAQDIPVVDLQNCLRDARRPDRELYAEAHPTSLGNDILSRCLVRELAALKLLPKPATTVPAPRAQAPAGRRGAGAYSTTVRKTS